jgi:hypothetical protein
MDEFMITKDIVLISALVALAAGQVLAYPLSYGPFETNQAPASVPLHQCDLIQQTGTPKTPPNWGTDDGVAGMTRLYRDKQQPRWSVQLIGTTNGWLINLLDEHGRNRIIGTATNGMSSDFIEVYSAGLNGDDQPDFMVNVWSGGCGLAAEMSETTFLLSATNGYRATAFEMWDFGRPDLITVHQTHYLILTRFIDGAAETARDQRRHNYWEYQLRRIDGDTFVPANDALPGFPKWVWYSFKENHQATDLLTPEQKQRLLNKN